MQVNTHNKHHFCFCFADEKQDTYSTFSNVFKDKCNTTILNFKDFIKQQKDDTIVSIDKEKLKNHLNTIKNNFSKPQNAKIHQSKLLKLKRDILSKPNQTKN